MGVQAGQLGNALGAAVVPVAAAWIGGLIGALGAGGRRALTVWIVHFAAGAFLALALVHLLPEAADGLRWPGALLSAAAGFGACLLLARWAGGFCPACSLDHTEPLSNQLHLPLLAVVTVHSALDGLALAHSGPVDRLGLVSAVVLVHKLPEGIAVAAVARAAGSTIASALLITVLVESSTFLGLIAGNWATGLSPGVLAGADGFTAGSFIYLAAITVLGDSHTRRSATNVAFAAVGAVLAGGVLLQTAGH